MASRESKGFFVGDSIVKKTDSRLLGFSAGSKDRACDGKDGAGHGDWQGMIHTSHVWTNNVDREGTTPTVKKYRNLLKRTKQATIGKIILSGILPVIAGRNQ